jgi:ubiquitin-like protein 5
MPRSPSPDRRERASARDRSASPRRDGDSKPDAKPWSERRTKELSFYKKSSSSYGSGAHSRGTVGDVGEEETAKERAQRRERGEVPKRFGGSREQGVRNTMGNVAAASVGASTGSLKRTGDPLDRMGVRGSGRERERGLRDERGGDRERERERRSDRERERRDDRDRGDRERRDRDRGDRDRDSGRERDSGRDRDRDRAGREERDMRHPDRREAASNPATTTTSSAPPPVRPGRFIEVIANDRMGRKGEYKRRRERCEARGDRCGGQVGRKWRERIVRNWRGRVKGRAACQWLRSLLALVSSLLYSPRSSL